MRPEDAIGERERAELDVQSNPLAGKPLRRRYRNFTPQADSYLTSLGGPVPYMQRLRRIEDETDAQLARLAEAYAEHAGDPSGWAETATSWDFGSINELIDAHNRWFPIEARLPMDPKTRDFVAVGGRSYTRAPLDARWILDRFPPEAL